MVTFQEEPELESIPEQEQEQEQEERTLTKNETNFVPEKIK